MVTSEEVSQGWWSTYKQRTLVVMNAIRDFTEHTGLCFRNVAYIRHGESTFVGETGCRYKL
jgi:hypothetical protein